MAIKQSALEKKWYYRIVKVFFLALPLIYVAIIFLSNWSVILSINENNISEIAQNNFYNIIFTGTGIVVYYLLLKLIWKISVYIIFGGIENDVNVKGGNMVQGGNINTTSSPNNFNEAGPLVFFVIIFVFIFLAQSGFFSGTILDPIDQDHIYGASCKSDGKNGLYGTDSGCYTCSSGIVSTQKFENCSGGKAGIYCCSSIPDDTDNGCIETGCYGLWYCSGRYYIDGQEITVPGLCFPNEARNIYPSWSGICRKCP